MRNKSVAFLLFLICLVFSCNKGSDQEQTEKEEEKQKEEKHIYYFSHSSYEGLHGKSLKDQNVKTKVITREVKSFAKVPKAEHIPWTESIRISAMGFFNEEPFFIVNKVGIFSFSSVFSQPLRVFSNELFPLFSAVNCYNTDIGFLVHSYKTNIFNELNNAEQETDSNIVLPILNRYNPITQDLEAIFFSHHFALPSYAILTTLTYNDAWYASFKIDNGEKVEFRYFKFANMSDILNATYESVTESSFRKAVTPLEEKDKRFLLLNKSFIKLFKKMEEENVLLEYFDPNNLSSVKIIKSKNASFEDIEGEGVAFCNASYSAILLENGKLYLNIEKVGEESLEETYVLPSLQQNFLYRYVAIYDDVLFASWEEQDFYERGRAGFITIPLSMLKKENTKN